MNEFVNKTYGEAIALVAERFADCEALVFQGRRYTFGQVKGEIDNASARLAELGLKAGDSVSIWIPNRPEFIWYWLGASQLGVVAVILNTRLRSEEFVYQLKQSDSRALIVPGPGSFRDFLGEALKAVPELNSFPPGSLKSPEFPELQYVICCDAPGDAWPGVLDWSRPPVAPPPMPELAQDPGKPALIAYSSGTTSLPKGVVLDHCGWRKAYDAGERADLTEKDKLYLCVPLFGVLANINGVMVLWARGGTVVLEERFEAEKFLKALREEKCTIVYMLAPMLYKLLEHPGFDRSDLASVRTGIIVSTDPEVFRLAKDRLGLDGFLSSYGMTETTAVVTRTRWDDRFQYRLACHGMPLPDIEIKVVDPETGQSVSAGAIGEILVRGYCNLLHYYKNPEATKKAFAEDGWFRTGDAGYMNPDGTLTFKTRLGDGYKHKGFNVAPAEVEAAVTEHPVVAEAQVVGLPDPISGYEGAVFIIVEQGQEFDAADILEFLRPKLASFKMPRYVFDVQAFPRTSGTEKVQKYKLREMAISNLARAEQEQGSRSDTPIA